jgi:subtilase family serine protease
MFFVGPTAAATTNAPASASTSGGANASVFTANPPHVEVAPSMNNPSSISSFAPYCQIFCYPPSFIKAAYDFPPTSGPGALTGRGQTIVIVDAFGSPTLQSDVNTFDSSFGLPAITVQVLCGPTWTGGQSDKCPQDVPGSGLDNLCGEQGWAFETTLDVDMAHAMAPGAKIVLAVANSCEDQDLAAAELAVVSQPRFGGSIMSQSFGEPDYMAGCSNVCTQPNATIVNAFNRAYEIANLNHWTILASSGDDGANTDYSQSGYSDATLTPSFPSTNPLVLAAGATQGNPYFGQYNGDPGALINGCPANTRCDTGLVVISGGRTGCGTGTTLLPSTCVPIGYGGESTWNEFNFFGPGTSSGGGVSTIYAKPYYQFGEPNSVTTLLGATVKTDGRTTPDVSFNGAANGGVLIYDGFVSVWTGVAADNSFYIMSGTSVASPSWAGIIALLDQAHGGSVGFVNAAIYALGNSREYNSAFHDITQGNNSDTAGTLGVDGFTAGPGYDLTTGWGSPNVSNFIRDIQSPQFSFLFGAAPPLFPTYPNYPSFPY